MANHRIPNILLRVVTAALLLPAFYWLLKMGGMFYAALLLLGSLWAGYEWLAMTNRPPQKRVWVPVLFVLALTWGIAIQNQWPLALLVPLVTSLVFMAVLRITRVQRPVLLSMGLSYLASAMVGLLSLRALPHGFSLTVLLCATVWMTDTGAYFAGRIFRGARLAPDISPSKTWAGFMGGLCAAGATAVACNALFTPAKPWVVIAVVLGLSLASQCGDLFESWVKRQSGVKDSGDIIPGHGGLLDRVDGLIMATLFFWVAFWVFDYDLSWWIV